MITRSDRDPLVNLIRFKAALVLVPLFIVGSVAVVVGLLAGCAVVAGNASVGRHVNHRLTGAGGGRILKVIADLRDDPSGE